MKHTLLTFAAVGMLATGLPVFTSSAPELPGAGQAPAGGAAPAAGPGVATAGEVMAEALKQGGTSFDSLYVNVNGESGYFARSLDAYGREGLPCNRCGTPIVRRSFMNRSSYLCPRCQRKR